MSQDFDGKLIPDFLFEVSWEVCNKVGGIHTVVATKAGVVKEKLADNYMVIGPDIQREGVNPEFEEDSELLKGWRQAVYAEGIRIRVGRWKIESSPIAVLVDFSQFINSKDDVLKFMWENYKVDSISGQWDYLEPVLFGYVAAKVIENYVSNFCLPTDKAVAHFHEWMTSSGGLYLQKYSPYVATVFTTHATVMGRSIAGNGLPLYGDIKKLNADELARKFGVVAKHSLEKTAAKNYDCFATVSDITSRECKYLLGHEVNIVTPNGFEDDFVWPEKERLKKRKSARERMVKVAEVCLGIKYDKEPLIVGTSGRYEYKNKGLDVFLDSLIELAGSEGLERPVLAYITVPAGNVGPRHDLKAWLSDPTVKMDPTVIRHITHYLAEPKWDPIINKIKGTALENPESPVQVMFVPSYLNGYDGIFDRHYYELLSGMDITVFASYYEPWGYTPLESVAFSVPTITTSLAGFGLWVNTSLEQHQGVEVIPRTDTNDAEVSSHISKSIRNYCGMSAKEYGEAGRSALEISRIALWENLVEFYWEAYKIAFDTMESRSKPAPYEGGGASYEQINFVKQQLVSNEPSWKRIMVERKLPERLRPLEELSRNLWWSWHPEASEVWEYIDGRLWKECGMNPIFYLDKLSYERCLELEKDETFLAKMDSVYAWFREYMDEKKDASGPKIAYFSMEYGLHTSLKIYSGGLGILAGDYLKEASDKNIPMVAVGLLYRYGYFTQKISARGEQEAAYEQQNFMKLPISPVRDEKGNWMSVKIAFPGRIITGRIWRCDVGRIELYLLDTDHDLNMGEDRSITYQLYGGDWENRLKQEILLGIGGIRTLKSLDFQQDVYHCNEGHAAFIGIERIYNIMSKGKLSFSEAMEVVRSSSLFTTHTPVPAGHDAFPESMIRQYMSHYPERLEITWEQFINLGKTKPNDPNEKFSMSSLACNLSQEVNGVSWLHGEVSKEILGDMWPGYFKDELHIGYVTNGVHFHTWIADNLKKLYERYFPEGFMQKNYDIAAWQKVHDIDDAELWKERLFLKEKLVKYILSFVNDPKMFKYDSPRQMIQVIESLKPDTLTIGFARRFATYKRANLLFTNLERLDSIINNPERPVQFLFAGKAHPNDKPGQDLIKRIAEVASMPRFIGKILFLQNYDMELARNMVQGVDVWLNTPTRPLEASGTSGEKAVMNGTIHFSVLDGWWVEGYKEGAGWALPLENSFDDPVFQNEMDAEIIYSLLEEEIVPRYYNRGQDNIPHEWVKVMKASIAGIASNFTTNRMLTDYENKYYSKLFDRNTQIRANNFALAREIAGWKRKVSKVWDDVKIIDVKQPDAAQGAMFTGEGYKVKVLVDTAGLPPEEIGVEMIFARQITDGNVKVVSKTQLSLEKTTGNIAYYQAETMPSMTGTFDMAVRLYPKNPKLPHRMDFALVKWA